MAANGSPPIGNGSGNIKNGSGNIKNGSGNIKGPYERLKYDMRRLWECPECHHRQRKPGHVSVVFCDCQKNHESKGPIAMQLVKEGGRRDS